MRVNLIKQVKDLYNEKSLKEDIEEDSIKWKNLPCYWIGRINLIKMPIYRFNANPIKILTKFFKDIKRTKLNFIWKNKKPRIVKKNNLFNQRTSGGITIPDFKFYYRTTITKIACYWHKNRYMDHWNQIEDDDTKVHTYVHLIFEKEAKIVQWKKESIFQKWC